MRKKHLSSKFVIENEINILPLIDVLFAILLFFMILSTVLTEKKKITVERPTSSQADNINKAIKTITITLKANKELYINGTDIGLEQLYMKLKSLNKDNSIDQVLIDAEKESTYGDVIEIISIAKKSDLKSISLAVDQKDGD
jgi:biopolymer transport protein ExbD